MRVMVLASGRGTDFQAIADHLQLGILRNVELSCLVCNHSDAPVLGRAEKMGVKALFFEGVTGLKFSSVKDREEKRLEFDRRCISLVREMELGLVVLAGFDQILTSQFVEACPFKILNIHPAYDLRRFGGKNRVGRKVHELVLQSGANYSGCTVHYVTADVDLGPAFLKKRVEISDKETPESLEKKVLQLEHLAYPEAIQLVADERVIVAPDGKMCYVDRYSDDWDLEWEERQQKYIVLNQ